MLEQFGFPVDVDDIIESLERLPINPENTCGNCGFGGHFTLKNSGGYCRFRGHITLNTKVEIVGSEVILLSTLEQNVGLEVSLLSILSIENCGFRGHFTLNTLKSSHHYPPAVLVSGHSSVVVSAQESSWSYHSPNSYPTSITYTQVALVLGLPIRVSIVCTLIVRGREAFEIGEGLGTEATTQTDKGQPAVCHLPGLLRTQPIFMCLFKDYLHTRACIITTCA